MVRPSAVLLTDKMNQQTVVASSELFQLSSGSTEPVKGGGR